MSQITSALQGINLAVQAANAILAITIDTTDTPAVSAYLSSVQQLEQEVKVAIAGMGTDANSIGVPTLSVGAPADLTGAVAAVASAVQSFVSIL